MTCDEALDRLAADLDGELDALASRDLARHVAGCADCARARAAAEALGARVREALPYHAAPDALRERLAARFAAPVATAPAAHAAPLALPVRPRRVTFAGRALAVAATLLLLATGGWVVAERVGLAGFGGEERRLAEEVISAHVRALEVDHLADVASTDQHTVKPWFAGKLDFAPQVTDYAEAGFPLVGGRLDYVGGRPVAALVYARRKHVINVFEWPATSAHPDRDLSARSERGFHVASGAHGGFEYWCVSDLNAEELAGFARRLLAQPPG
jgi:anti-sigma factor RsiW